jgi:receptor protein-tyrosine kinase
MGRIFEALQRSSGSKTSHESAPGLGAIPEIVDNGSSDKADFTLVRSLPLVVDSEDRIIAMEEQRTLGTEKIRILAARLRQLQDQRGIRKLLVTSSVRGEGKTVLSTNLAISLAKTKQRVLLIDGDSHRPNAARVLGVSGLPGLTDWWGSEGAIQDYLVRYNGISLWLLPAGDPIEQNVGMLQSSRFSGQLDYLSSWFDWIIIDSPPSAPLADAAVWCQRADAVLLVTREATTPKRLLKKVLDSLDHDKVLGIVLNDCSDRDERYYAQYYNLQQQ